MYTFKHYKKYKNPISINDKNESLPQPIKSLSSSSCQLIEDYVAYSFAADRLPGPSCSKAN